MIIYADVLISINLLITYIFLVCCRVFTDSPTRKINVAIASLAGGISSLLILVEGVGVLLSVVYKLITGFLITTVAFSPKTVKKAMRVFMCFSGINLLFGGLILFLQITVSPHNVIFYNGTVYFNMTVEYLVGVVFAVYGVFVCFDRLLIHRTAKNEIYDLSIVFRDTSVSLRGMVDTGNNMSDGLSGNMVFIVYHKALSPLFTCEEMTFFEGGSISVPPSTLGNAYRLLPCSTVNGSSLMSGIVPQRVKIKSKDGFTEIQNVTLGITKEKISSGDYDVLLNKGIYDERWKGYSGNEKTVEFLGKNKK